ncbi:MAG: hypothetical protein M1831_007430 [Alyxoria varia]|nr:MAG: hypothetical protein M1831_007430 [Alyxoria varia]
MTVRNTNFTPTSMLSAPRREPGIPNWDGSKILYRVQTYTFSTHKWSHEIRVLDVQANASELLDDNPKSSSPCWVGKTDIVAVLRSVEKGRTELRLGELTEEQSWSESSYVAGVFNGPVANLKIREVGHNRIAYVVSGPAAPDGSMYNDQEAPKPRSSGRLYKSLFVRHWDSYVTAARQAIWYGVLLQRQVEESESSETSERLAMSDPVNPLKRTGIESPIPPEADSSHFDVSPSGIVLVAKDPELNQALHTKCNLYLIPLTDFTEGTPAICAVNVPEMEGAMTSPSFSADGKKIAFLSMVQDGYEADKNHVFIIPDVKRPSWVVRKTILGPGRRSFAEQWDASPKSVKWSQDGRSLFVEADHQGQNLLWQLSGSPVSTSTPQKITTEGSIKAFYPLPNGNIIVSSSSFLDPSIFSCVTFGDTHPDVKVLSSITNKGARLGLHPTQIQSFWYPGAAAEVTNLSSLLSVRASYSTAPKVHSWMILPAGFDKSKQYPLAILVHGGPQSAWNNAWQPRWNAMVYAEQGYVVVLPNITGSTGYGQDFVDAIRGQWGGHPYRDLEHLVDYIQENIPYVDPERMVALGASYGGYMMNWVQGHPLGRKMKALVCHDGVFDTSYEVATDELYFVEHDFEGPWWGGDPEVIKSWLKWSPAHHTKHWSTPQLVVHSERDYRLTMSDGLAAFNVLQARGVPSQFLTFPDETHFVSDPENSRVWHETVLGFINERVKLPAPTKGEDSEDAVMEPGEVSWEESSRIVPAQSLEIEN